VNRSRLGLALLGLALAALPLAAPAQVVAEAELKAAFIYNFALFTEWPPGALEGDGPFLVCIAPGSPLRAALARLAGQPLHGRHLALLDVAEPVWSEPRCQVAVLDGGAAPPSRRGLMTVADGEAAAGAVITLAVQDEHLRFDVDAAAARGAGLALSSKLLRLARTVQ
jgi:hypothetical protein